MNWGNKFPSGDSIDTAMQYPWGWYTVNVPNEGIFFLFVFHLFFFCIFFYSPSPSPISTDPLLDFAVVVGVGTVKNKDTLGKSWAAFGDFIIGGKHIGVRKV
jgi:hypothetical protein